MPEKEPSLLDYLRSLLELQPEKYRSYLHNNEEQTDISRPYREKEKTKFKFSFLPILALAWAILGQVFLEPAQRNTGWGILCYSLAGIALLFFIFVKRGQFQTSKKQDKPWLISQDIRIGFLFPATVFLAAAFWFFKDNQFTLLNVSLWIIGLALFVLAVWEKQENSHLVKKKIDLFVVLVVLVAVVSIFFRTYELQKIPSEMFSDHAEKLLDVADVLDGNTSIFFVRNTGREALQFYLTAAIIKIFHTDISFLSLKLGTVLAGLLTLPFIYLIGKELGGKWTGLAALFLAGVGYWPNVISRVALRYAFYPLFTAATFYYLIKGLRSRKRNDFLIAGLLMGVGMHGYSSARFLPIVVTVVFLIYLLTLKTKQEKNHLIWMFLLVAVAAFFVFLPLFRYLLENPAMFSYRASTRLLPIEQDYPGNPLLIFLSNFWNAITMFFNNNGEIWVHSIPNRPAFDVISAALYFIGAFFALIQSVKKKNWLTTAILVSIPLLLMPSILSLVYPGENPSLNRTSGAYVLAFVIAGYGWSQISEIFLNDQPTKARKNLIVILCLGLGLGCGLQNYDLVFNQYREEYNLNAWNTSEIAVEIERFYQEGGETDNAFVLPYPYWVDTRLVGINAGLPRKDYAIWPEDFETKKQEPGTYLFILKPEDIENIDLLQALFPNNTLYTYSSETPGKNFIEIRVQN
ncbi:MAG: glycosyltransferase family 39 protein [Anaerolineaceae bacterium]